MFFEAVGAAARKSVQVVGKRVTVEDVATIEDEIKALLHIMPNLGLWNPLRLLQNENEQLPGAEEKRAVEALRSLGLEDPGEEAVAAFLAAARNFTLDVVDPS